MCCKSLDPLYALLFKLLILSLLQYILPLYPFIYLCVYVCMMYDVCMMYVEVGVTHNMGCMWRSEGSLMESVLFFHLYMGL